MDHPRHSLRQGRRGRSRRSPAPLVDAANIVVHFAAETHVDRSIANAGEFITTDVYGTFVLLEAARQAPGPAPVRPDLDRRGLRQRARTGRAARPTNSGRATPIRRARPAPIGSRTATGRPTSVPVDHHARIEQLRAQPVPREGDPALHHQRDRRHPACRSTATACNERDWLHVSDHCRALDVVIEAGASGEVYNVGGGNHVRNIDLTQRILELVGKPESLIQPGRRSARPRPPVLARHDEAPERSAGSRRSRSTGGLARNRRLVPPERVVVAPDQGRRSGVPRVLRRRSTATAAPDACAWLVLPLVTGATGFAGSHLVEHLLANATRLSRRGHTAAAAAGVCRRLARALDCRRPARSARGHQRRSTALRPSVDLPLRRHRARR